MLDGAGASTFLDLIDERNQEEIKKNSKIIDTPKENNEVPFANTARDQNKKNVVFIDSAVSDYETIINSFKENTEFYLINSNEDGFKRISEILNDLIVKELGINTLNTFTDKYVVKKDEKD